VPTDSKRPKRKHKPKGPVFAPVERLEIGAPFNPYKQFVYGEVLRQVLSCGMLTDSQAKLWILLADQCLGHGFDRHSQTRLAAMLAWKPRKLRRHLRELKKLNLVHVEWNLGAPSRTWLLFHPLFALCSPVGQVKNDLRVGQIWPKGQVKNDHNMDLPHGSLHGSNHESSNVGTSNSASSAARGDDLANGNGWRKAGFAVPITNRLETLAVSPTAKAFWFGLSPLEKKHRRELAEAAAAKVHHYRQYINDSNHEVAGQARHEVKRWHSQVRAHGFYIPGIEPKGKP
jgi:hypothetical protein